MLDKDGLARSTAIIVGGLLQTGTVSIDQIPGVIDGVRQALMRCDETPVIGPPPAVPIEESIQDEYLVCLEDGHHTKTMRRYLRQRFGMTPEEYRAKWRLPSDYPMAAPSYSRQRKEMAIKIGLGRRPRKAKKSA